MTAHMSDPALWGWPLTAIQFWFLAAMVGVAVGRQLFAWGAGYWRYGRKSLTLCRAARTHHPHLPRLAMRCGRHLDRPLHPDQRHDQNPMSYKAHQGDASLVLRPVAVGTRHWSYDAVEGKRIGWAGWMRRCLCLAARKRFADPSVGPCHYC
ncbi:hypothetical protein [Candidatus Poriferisodalis sp.]|uniref:hypothetical protein n=1 Tax=Candidatus Poriferisodalis sp. TaxID=3101277 RepID=UPI003B5A5F5C